MSRREAPADPGDLVIVLLAITLADLRDRLHIQGYEQAAEFVADLAEATDDYIVRIAQ